MNITWICKKFDELSVHELYDVIRLRNDVFIVDQKCIFQDADGLDPIAFHVLGYDTNKHSKLVVYCRLFGPGQKYEYPAISRVCCSLSYRSQGAGKLLISKAIEVCSEQYGNLAIQIGAQNYLRKFYGSFGFVVIGDIYDEDGIEHVEMVKQATTSG